jgi:DNA polymerase III delta subunit
MITVLTGDNSFEIHEALTDIVTSFDGRAEKVEGSSLQLRDLPDLLMGSSLFADKRLVIITDISQNATLWAKLPEWLSRVSDDISLVLVDTKPDKRTSSYKALKEAAEVKEYAAWTDRDHALAEAWLARRASLMNMQLDKKLVRLIVNRAGHDQWQLAHALDKLSLLDSINEQTIEDTIEPNPSENIFQLFELALDGDAQRLHSVLATLELSEDAYAVFGLLSSQALQLAVVATADGDKNPSKEFGIHPYVASKLARHAKKRGAKGAQRIVQAFADADADLKSSRGEPWLVIEKTLLAL